MAEKKPEKTWSSASLARQDSEQGFGQRPITGSSSTLGPGFKLCPSSDSSSSDLESDRSFSQKLRSFTLGRRSKSKSLDGRENGTLDGCKEKKKGRWNLKFNYKLRSGANESPDLPESSSCSCVCTGYRRTEEHHLGAGIVFESSSTYSRVEAGCSSPRAIKSVDRAGGGRQGGLGVNGGRRPVVDLSKFNPDDYPTDDCDEKARAQRAWEMAEGVDPPPGYNPSARNADEETRSLELRERHGSYNMFASRPLFQMARSPRLLTRLLEVEESSHPKQSAESHNQQVHSQVDYFHCLVPDLLEISNCGFYWGKMDRYEAERLLENKQEGTFLLRDSAQEDYLFSVSFRRYGRSLHARIEQWNHKFTFDSLDPGVFSSDTVCGLIEHYKDPSCCMFFEPMLTIPLYRTFTFLLQHLCRSTICRMVTYDGVNQLQLPKPLKLYLKEYHYKQRVKVRRLEVDQ